MVMKMKKICLLLIVILSVSCNNLKRGGDIDRSVPNLDSLIYKDGKEYLDGEDKPYNGRAVQLEKDKSLTYYSFLNGKLDGEVKRVNNQNILMTGFYKNGSKSGIWKIANNEGLFNTYEYIEGNLIYKKLNSNKGFVEERFSENLLNGLQLNFNKEKNRLVREHYQYGVLIEREIFVKDLLIEKLSFTEKEKIIKKFENDKLIIKQVEDKINRFPIKKIEYYDDKRIEKTYEKNKDSYIMELFISDEMVEKSTYSFGKKNGIYQKFINKKLLFSGLYKDDLPVDIWSYYKNDKMFKRIKFIKDKIIIENPLGTEKEYSLDKEGRILKKYELKNGVVEYATNYNFNGDIELKIFKIVNYKPFNKSDINDSKLENKELLYLYNKTPFTGRTFEMKEDLIIRNYKDGKQSGEEIHYQKGTIMKRFVYENGIFTGDYKEYYNDGKIKRKQSKINNIKIVFDYHKNGDLNYSDRYLSDRIVRTNYSNGEIISKGSLIKDKKNGDWFYYKNGVIITKGHYKSDEKIGEWQNFYNDGNLKEILNYELDKTGKSFLNGFYNKFYENGMLKVIGSYKNNKKTGSWETYAEDGKILNQKRY